MNAFLDSSGGFFGWLWLASWQAAVVVVLVCAAQWLFARQLSPRWRHALWFLVIIRLVLPMSVGSPVSLFNFFSPHSFSTRAPAPDSGAAVVVEAPGDSSGAILALAPAGRSRAGLRSIWLAGAVMLSAFLLASAMHLGRKIRRQRLVTNEAVLTLLEDCKQEMGVPTPLVLLETSSVKSPALLGFVRPRLLLPEGLLRSFSLPELRFVFLHELGHVRRGDILLNWLLAVPLVLHWFNPLVWYAVLRMRADGEAACDVVALSCTREGENQPYGQTIIKLLERFSNPALAPGLVGILENKNQMKRRIGMIATFKKTQRKPFWAAALFAVLALVVLTDAQSQPTAGAGNRQSNAGESAADGQPRVIASFPRAGDSEVDPAITEITVTFDRDMSEGYSWTGSNRKAVCPPMPEGQQAHWRDRRTCVFPVALEAAHFYRVGINSTSNQNFRDTNGVAAAQSVLYFTTRGADEATRAKLTRPKVVSFIPPNGATDVDTNLKELRVTFDIPMDRGYSWTGPNLQQPPEYLINSIHWTNTYTCVLPVVLKPDHQYVLGINGLGFINFQSSNAGVPASPVEYTFTTRK
jgi:beta-lactamase regulating signal transducer with metallopeptidase domain